MSLNINTNSDSLDTGVNLKPYSQIFSNENKYFSIFNRQTKNILVLLNLFLFIVFGFRYYYDQQNIKLKKQLEVKTLAAKQFRNDFLSYKNLENIALFIDSKELENKDSSEFLQFLLSSQNNNVRFSKIEYQKNSLTIGLKTKDAVDFSIFIANLKENKSIKSLSIGGSDFDKKTESYIYSLVISI